MTAPRPLQIALILLATGVWGAVAFSLSRALGDEDPEETVVAHSRPLDIDTTPPPPYAADFRDPFAPAPRLSSARPAARSSPPSPPQLRLLATIDDAALVSLPSGETRYVRRGDKVAGAHVSAVSRGSLVLRVGTATFELTLAKEEEK